MIKLRSTRNAVLGFMLFLGLIFYAEYKVVGNREIDDELKTSNLAFRRRAADTAKSVEETKQSTSSIVSEEQLKHVGYDELTDDKMAAIELRFKKRRDLLTKSCIEQGHGQVETYDEMPKTQKTFLLNQILHDSSLKLSGCLPPKTGSTSWNHFWWGTSKFDGAKAGQFDSFQSQGNRQTRKWIKTLDQERPEVLFLTTRHPIQRLISGWNNILCNTNCRHAARVTYAKKAKETMKRIYQRVPNMNGKFNESVSDGVHMLSFPALVDMLIKDFSTLDKQSQFDIHFHSYERSCFICDIPYKYIVRLETFTEDYQFLTRKLGLWDQFDDVHKLVGSSKENESVGLNYTSVLRQLAPDQLTSLIELKQSEMDMFGYVFDEGTLKFEYIDGT